MAARDNRSYILSRRENGISDLNTRTPLNGELDLEQAEKAGFYNINCTHQIGIATSTEVGLTAERYPIRVVVGAARRLEDDSETVAHYWPITDSSGKSVGFSRKPLATELGLSNLYKFVPELDDKIWDAYKLVPEDIKAPIGTEVDATKAVMNALHAVLMTPIPTDEQGAEISKYVDDLLKAAAVEKKVVVFKVGDNAYMWGKPHGQSAKGFKIGDHEISKNRLVNHETALCIMVNYSELKKRNAQVSDGVLTQCSYAIASMFRFGLNENYEHREYHTVRAEPIPNSPGSYKIVEWKGADGMAAPEGLAIGGILSVMGVKLDRIMAEIGNLYCYLAGVMHYMFNHTTGGMLIQGPLMTSMTMYNLYNRQIAQEEGVRITSAVYESLHPVNKRAIAALFFKESGVHTWGRMSGAPRLERLSLDTFSRIRSQPYPAGSHKAYLCLAGLKMILKSGMAVFLPWAGEVSSCINICSSVLKSGARAHIGSHYYTGEYPRAQSSNIDTYLPEVAAYVNTFHRADTLCYSAHLSQEVANKASMSWSNLLKGMRASDISATNIDIVKKFLQTQGTVKFEFNPDDETTWASARATADAALQAIENIFV